MTEREKDILMSTSIAEAIRIRHGLDYIPAFVVCYPIQGKTATLVKFTSNTTLDNTAGILKDCMGEINKRSFESN